MRPEILFDLFRPLSSLPGVGPKTAERLKEKGCSSPLDLCWRFPYKLIERHFIQHLSHQYVGSLVTLVVQVVRHQKRKPYRVTCMKDGKPVDLIFFQNKGDYIEKLLPIGSERLVSGRLESFHGSYQITHPDHIGPFNDKDYWSGVQPQYALTAGITGKGYQKLIDSILKYLPSLPEWIPQETLQKFGWKSWKDSLHEVHHPQRETDLYPSSPSRQRLAYDELLAHQLALALVRTHHHQKPGISFVGKGDKRRLLEELLPFKLTEGQQKAIQTIYEDMESSKRMLRLLLGDVGSGKTIVAFFAVIHAIESGYQGAFLAPTEILALQHFETFERYASSLGIRVGLLTGQKQGKDRKQFLEDLKEGHIDIAIGTHALLEEKVQFHKLGLAVIDEQHRFGVQQRLNLMEKGENVDVLVMSATPIPRTLMLTLYGELSVAKLAQKPANRKPIATRVLPLSRINEIYTGLERVLSKGGKIYWVCPLIEESEVLDLGHATARYDSLKDIFGNRVALLHGKMKGDEKEDIMNRFKSGHVDILVSTTVIEVGVDVPQASVMAIEHAERFGLAQLHQLRGRVGRGDTESACLLLYGEGISSVAHARLEKMRETEDGFEIAEADLKLRGGGEILGTKQSGMPEFHIADPYFHQDLLMIAHEQAEKIIEMDPLLKGPLGQRYRVLLHLLKHQNAVPYLIAG
jgi:ATP-dependent DNA helicase RecG